ncbi:uncharacterized protein J3D65DRAFT_159630 [Phyllosticta citribraziliensis]|uniref:Uncharacterized protein n=1 Tax=Phyllosticta citribraziliensis TaxID=989973 RepID=A0ABR1L3N9_9PEZI
MPAALDAARAAPPGRRPGLDHGSPLGVPPPLVLLSLLLLSVHRHTSLLLPCSPPISRYLFSPRRTPCRLFGTGSASCNLMRDMHSYRSFCHPHLSHLGADVARIADCRHEAIPSVCILRRRNGRIHSTPPPSTPSPTRTILCLTQPSRDTDAGTLAFCPLAPILQRLHLILAPTLQPSSCHKTHHPPWTHMMPKSCRATH